MVHVTDKDLRSFTKEALYSLISGLI